MKLLKPNEISGSVLTLIEEAEEFVYLITPYVKISKWYKLRKKLDKAVQKVDLQFVIRDDDSNWNSFEELDEMGYNYKAIPDLHCKLYISEKAAVVSSMNLLLSSEINSLELGYQTETSTEYEELLVFCRQYLHFDSNQNPGFDLWLDSLVNTLHKHKEFTPVIKDIEDGIVYLDSGYNNYKFFIANERTNFFRISGIISQKEYYSLSSNIKLFKENTGLEIEPIKGGKGYYSMLWGTLKKPLSNNRLYSLSPEERVVIKEKVIKFVEVLDEWKSG